MKTLYILFAFVLTTAYGEYCTNSVNLRNLGLTVLGLSEEECYEAVKLHRDDIECTGETYQYNTVAGDCGCATDNCTLKSPNNQWKIMRQTVFYNHTCNCTTGFNGTDCENDINECDPDPCQNGATCTESGTDISVAPGEFECSCPSGFEGDLCNITTAICQVDTCQNGGNCSDIRPYLYQTTANSNSCDDMLGYQSISESECLHAATLADEFYPKEGKFTYSNANYPYGCILFWQRDNGAIIYNSDPTGGVCTEESPCLCQPSPLQKLYECDCEVGYQGDNCELDINECIVEPCHFDAICKESSTDISIAPGEFECLCVELFGYTGKLCNECGPGKGQDVDGLCTECSEPQINNVTSHSAPCADQECPEHYGVSSDNWKNIGVNCEECMEGEESPAGSGVCTDINECDPDPCQNGAMCSESGTNSSVDLGEYTCDCLPGYNGTNCEEDINKCEPNPCQNAGNCTETSDGYECDCEVGYQGDNCELDINECIVEPCHFDAICKESSTDISIAPGEFECLCVELFGYTGKLCNECGPGKGQDVDGLCTECSEPQINNVTSHSAPCADQECPEHYGVSSDNWKNIGVNCEECMEGEESPAGSGVCTDINECDPDPCQNGAMCSESGTNSSVELGDYTCDCLSGYNGTNCEEDLNECDPDPCQNGGICTQGIGEYTCDCLPGYNGTDCEDYIGMCSTEPCQNQGNCTEADIGEYTCDCLTGFEGLDCEVDVNECLLQPCQHQGICTETTDGVTPTPGLFHCACSEYFGYSGFLCDECQPGSGRDDWGRCTECSEPEINNVTTSTAPCAHQSCSENFGVSSDNWDVLGDNCVECMEGEESPAGSGVCTDINECDPDPCQNGAMCSESGTNSSVELGDYTCDCLSGYNGTNCEEDLNECDPDPCQNGGICTQGIGEYTCDCLPGYNGTDCEDYIGMCSTEPCQNQGNCTEADIGEYTCSCLTGYEGLDCEVDVNECLLQPCQHQGICTETIDGTTEAPGVFHCACSDYFGYTGKVCQFCERGSGRDLWGRCRPCEHPEINNVTTSTAPCADQECPVGYGVSSDNWDVLGDNCEECPIGQLSSAGSGVCSNMTCPLGYTGIICEEDIDECEPNPCRHNATCAESGTNPSVEPGEYTCSCPTGYTGIICDEDINECILGLDDCVGAAICLNTLGSFTCECPVGLDGPLCNHDMHECDPNPCQNGASCQESNINPLIELGEYTCDCLPGYTGTNCEEDINECDPDPCQNGASCIDGINDFTCNCSDTGYDGKICNHDIHECEPNPCQNGGGCTESNFANVNIGEYVCECPTGYSGINCEVNTNECQNNNDCINGLCGVFQNRYQCICFAGFEKSSVAECININECDPDPCQNGASCTDGIGEYTCECTTGYTGTNCEEDINECDPDPCQNGASCTDGIGEYTCECTTGYTGTNCQEDINECDADPCQNGATCVETSNGVYLTHSIYGYRCECTTGYTGTNCEEDINECDPDPCQNGASCTDGIGEYSCECTTGYTGTNCQEEINECDPDPCQNGASCTNGIGEYTCECTTGYTGTNCEEDINECEEDANICGDKFCRNIVGSYICDDCEKFFHYHDNDNSCHQNTCVCENGVASSPCIVEGSASCQNCDVGFQLTGNKCIEQSRELEEEEDETNWVITVLIVLLILAILWAGLRWCARRPVVVVADSDEEDGEETKAFLDRKIDIIF